MKSISNKTGLLPGLITLHFILIAFFSCLKILTYKSSPDLAIFNQAFWSMLHTGIPTITTVQPFNKLNWFGWHFSPVFYLLLPLYALYPSPWSLQLMQCLLLSLTAIPVASALKRIGLEDKKILALTALMLFNPFYFNSAIWEFHEIAIGCFLIALSYWALIARNKALFILSLFLLLLTKEHFGLSVGGFGLLWRFRHRDGWFGILIAIAGVAALVIILTCIVPWLNGNNSHPMLHYHDTATARYDWLSGSTGEIATHFFKLMFVSDFAVIPGIVYLIILFCTFGLLPLFSPVYLLPALADFTAILLSNNPMPRTITAYHSCSIIPVLTIAAGISLLAYEKYARKPVQIYQLLAVLVIVNICLWNENAVKVYELYTIPRVIPLATTERIRDIIKDSAVSVQPNIAFLFSDRKEIYTFPVHTDRSKFIILYLHHPYQDAANSPFATLYFYETPQEHYQKIREILASPTTWGIIMWENDWLILKKNTRDQTDARDAIRSRLEIMK